MTEHLLIQSLAGGDIRAGRLSPDVYKAPGGGYVVRVEEIGARGVVRRILVTTEGWTVCPYSKRAYRVATYLDDYTVDRHGEEQIVLTQGT